MTMIETLALVVMRMTTFLVIAPPFSHRAVPNGIKAMLAVLLAVLVAPSGMTPSSTAGEFIGRMFLEAVAGGGIGVLVMAVFAAVQSAGRLIDILGGFELGAAFDPLTMTQSGPFGRLYQLAAIVLLFVTDGYQMVILGLVRTFTVLPPGTGVSLSSLGSGLTEVLPAMLLAALQIAGPLVAVLFLADVALGLLTRVAPALNAFAMAFPLKILITLSLGAVAIAGLPAVVAGLVRDALKALMGVM
jgi:Flagellar biosynthesis pathway, component FliR